MSDTIKTLSDSVRNLHNTVSSLGNTVSSLSDRIERVERRIMQWIMVLTALVIGVYGLVVSMNFGVWGITRDLAKQVSQATAAVEVLVEGQASRFVSLEFRSDRQFS